MITLNVHGSWFVVRGSWFVVRGSWFLGLGLNCSGFQVPDSRF
jgi:hypothetical protein